MRKLLCLVLMVFVTAASPALAHYNMLFPDAASGKKGEAVTFTYQWGHPFEHQLFDAPKPEKVEVRAPDGKTEDLTKTLEKVALPAAEGKTVTGYRFQFKPEQRGDYVVLLKVPPIFLEEDGEFVQDTVKVVFHVQAQKGWDAYLQDAGFEWGLLMRPYGLEPGVVFQAETIPSALVEVEALQRGAAEDPAAGRADHAGGESQPPGRGDLHPDRSRLVVLDGDGQRSS